MNKQTLEIAVVRKNAMKTLEKLTLFQRAFYYVSNVSTTTDHTN